MRTRIKTSTKKIVFSTEFARRKNPNWSKGIESLTINTKKKDFDSKWDDFKQMLKSEL